MFVDEINGCNSIRMAREFLFPLIEEHIVVAHMLHESEVTVGTLRRENPRESMGYRNII